MCTSGAAPPALPKAAPPRGTAPRDRAPMPGMAACTDMAPVIAAAARCAADTADPVSESMPAPKPSIVHLPSSANTLDGDEMPSMDFTQPGSSDPKNALTLPHSQEAAPWMPFH